MMKKVLVLLTVILLYNSSYGQTPNWAWAKTATLGNNFYEAIAGSTATDASGNIYVTGYFQSNTIIFGAYTLHNTDTTGNTRNMFLVKYNNNGQVIWANNPGGNYFGGPSSIAVSDSGYVYVVGVALYGNIVFGTTTLYNQGTFIVKYDSSGNVLFAKGALGNSVMDGPNGVAVDALGNSYVTGFFFGHSITFGLTTLFNTNQDTAEVFIAKYGAGGNVIWAKRAGGNQFDGGYAVTTDVSNNIYVVGEFASDSISFGSFTLTNDTTDATEDIFIVKYDPNGNVLFAKSFGGNSNDAVSAVCIDHSGNIFIGGDFLSPVLNFDTISLFAAGYELFLVKLDSLGNTIWANSADGGGTYVALDAWGNSFITGSFFGSITFDTITFTNPSNLGIYLVKYDSSGHLLYAKSVIGTGQNEGYGVAVDLAGNCYVVGGFQSPTIHFGTTTLTNSNTANMFIAKIGSATTNVAESDTPTPPQISLFPNPTSGTFTLSYHLSTPDAAFQLFDISGRVVYKQSISGTIGKEIIDAKALINGMYFWQMIEGSGLQIPTSEIHHSIIGKGKMVMMK